MISSASQSTRQSRRRGIIDADPNAEISHINVRVASLVCILLHTDILNESVQDIPLVPESVTNLARMATIFFTKVAELNIGLGDSDLHAADQLMLSACELSHLRLMVAPIIVDGEEQRNDMGNILRLTVSMAHTDVREVMQNGLTTPLLEFPPQKVKPEFSSNIVNSSCKYSYKHSSMI